MSPTVEKRCRHCLEFKPPELFARNPKMKDGLSSWCKECHAAAVRRSVAKRREREERQKEERR